MQTFLLIDANALIHRAFHALPPLTTNNGKPSGALYGLANILIKILRDNPPTYVAAFFDRPEPTFRKEMYDEYKIHRPKAPDELVSQIIEAHNMFEIFGVKTFETPGFEADDLIGTAAEKFHTTENLQIIILTGDLDTMQLIKEDKVVVETLKKGVSETIIYNEDAVNQRFGVSPKQIPDYKGLVGDTSDNIPGVKGVGPKTAAAIIQKYGSLEKFFEKAETTPSTSSGNKAETNILEHKDIALMSKKLATINTDAPLKLESIGDVSFEKFDFEKIVAYFEELGFHSLIKRLGLNKTDETEKIIRPTKQQSIFENSGLSDSKQKEQPDRILKEIEMPLEPILREMEAWGIKTDIEKLKTEKEKLEKELKELTQKIHKEADKVFNINSPKQLLEVLKEKFRMKITSTNEDKLSAFKGKLEIVNLVLKYRELFKLKSTYIEPLIKISENTPRVHPTFVQMKAATGRITCENPNLQNIPESVRAVFTAEKNCKLASFDYSQIELRILASITGDKKMLETFAQGKDIHQMTAAQIFNVSLDSVDSNMRKLAKTLNFGIVYGMGARSLARESGLSQTDAKKFIAEYFNDFPSIKKWQEQIILKAKQDGFVENLDGRVRHIPEITSFNQRFQSEAERMAINFPIQSLAADILKLAMIRTKEKLVEAGFWGTKIKMLLTIHDELVFEITDDTDLEKIVSLIKETMEGIYKLQVPLVVNESIGENWEQL